MDGDVMDRLWKWAANTRKRHKRKGFEIQISRKEVYDLAINALMDGCRYCGCKLITPRGSGGKCHLHCELTLDVVNPKVKVLDKGNCQVICCSCNHGKMRMSEADYVLKCLRVVENMMGV